jgi:hypothetical protein
MSQEMYCSGAVILAKNRRFHDQKISLIMIKMKMLIADWSEKSCKTFHPLKRSGFCCWYRNVVGFCRNFEIFNFMKNAAVHE